MADWVPYDGPGISSRRTRDIRFRFNLGPQADLLPAAVLGDSKVVECHIHQFAESEGWDTLAQRGSGWRVIQQTSIPGIPFLAHLTVSTEYLCEPAAADAAFCTMAVSSLVNTEHPVHTDPFDFALTQWVSRSHKASHGAWMATVLTFAEEANLEEFSDELATSQEFTCAVCGKPHALTAPCAGAEAASPEQLESQAQQLMLESICMLVAVLVLWHCGGLGGSTAALFVIWRYGEWSAWAARTQQLAALKLGQSPDEPAAPVGAISVPQMLWRMASEASGLQHGSKGALRAANGKLEVSESLSVHELALLHTVLFPALCSDKLNQLYSATAADSLPEGFVRLWLDPVPLRAVLELVRGEEVPVPFCTDAARGMVSEHTAAL